MGMGINDLRRRAQGSRRRDKRKIKTYYKPFNIVLKASNGLLPGAFLFSSP
jgi:hypothetical protein